MQIYLIIMMNKWAWEIDNGYDFVLRSIYSIYAHDVILAPNMVKLFSLFKDQKQGIIYCDKHQELKTTRKNW